MANIFKKIANAGDLTDYAPSMDQGEHEIALAKYGVKETRDYGDMIEAEFLIIASTTHKPGTIVGDAWFISKPGLDGEYSRKRALAFGRQVVIALGDDPDRPVLDANGRQVVDEDGQPVTVVQETMATLASKEQPGTGIQLRASGKGRNTKKGRAVTNITYFATDNTASKIKENRDRITAMRPVAATAANVAKTVAATAPVVAPVTTFAPAPVAAPAAAPTGLLGGLLGR